MNLSQYFTAIVAKRLAVSEIESNQHEFNGIASLKEVLGTEEIKGISGKMIYLSDDDGDSLEKECSFTWYDARASTPERSPEFRLYYSDNEIILQRAGIDDLILIGVKPDNEIIVFVAPIASIIEAQLLDMFGISQERRTITVSNNEFNDIELDFINKYILRHIGIEVGEVNPVSSSYLDEMIEKFGNVFPTTAVFSDFTRSTFEEGELDVLNHPDATLMSWWNREGELMEVFENYVLEDVIAKGFEDKEAFLKAALTVVNRRKSRAGHSFENHLQQIFLAHKIDFTKGGKTEGNSKPDFLFPNVEAYNDKDFNIELLDMLGVKTTAKDRWRQVLAEANKVNRKHLITLQRGITTAQTDEMAANNLQLVIPSPIQDTYSEIQRESIISLSDFINKIKEKQGLG